MDTGRLVVERFRCGSDGMDLASTLTLGPCSEYLRLQVGAENSSFCGAKGPLSALEALRDALYKSTTTTTTTTTGARENVHDPPRCTYSKLNSLSHSHDVFAEGAGCGDGNFQCANASVCIPASLTCDGINDCGDYSDENNCSKRCRFSSRNVLLTSPHFSQVVSVSWTCENRQSSAEGKLKILSK